MKLASLKKGGRDGTLIVVDRDLKSFVEAGDIAATLQAALDDWQQKSPLLAEVYQALCTGDLAGSRSLEVSELASPLPRAYQFVDGSAYLAHVERVRRARGAEMPPSFLDDPLMYQAVSDGFLAPREDVVVASEESGIDFESEVIVVTDDVPMGVSEQDALAHIQLIGLINDVSLRNLIPNELGKGFGFVISKPRSALSPVLVTPDELGDAWAEAKVNLPLLTHYNGALFGQPECGVDMQFSFARLVAHAATTRPLAAGCIVGSGTIANQDESVGASCLAEKRVLEIVANGKASTPFMSFGDTIKIEMLDREGRSIFGSIDQTIVRYGGPEK
ncbi:MAG: fumarylacetoacetate hydrolase family protein [Gammaproteobacteria bacterium]|nr:fumarylacetoacetate hydrolase family protein [Gammaproteobacteria bacterium]